MARALLETCRRLQEVSSIRWEATSRRRNLPSPRLNSSTAKLEVTRHPNNARPRSTHQILHNLITYQHIIPKHTSQTLSESKLQYRLRDSSIHLHMSM